MDNIMEKIIDLVKKTGDRCIIIDKQSNEALTIIPFTEYRQLIEQKAKISELSQQELLNKINRDIGVWKSSHEGVDEGTFDDLQDFFANMDTGNAESEAENIGLNEQIILESEESPETKDEKYYFEPIE